jgi:hypothetical protein
VFIYWDLTCLEEVNFIVDYTKRIEKPGLDKIEAKQIKKVTYVVG